MEETRQPNSALTVTLGVEPLPLRAGGDVRWRLTVSNEYARTVALTFPTAQLGDVVLAREGGERYRWSQGQMFAQAITERRLDPGAAWTFTLEGALDVDAGAYEARGVLTCLPQPPPTRIPVTVEPGC